MNNNLEYEYEIDLKDLFISLLRKWRHIILAAVIGAVLLGGFCLMKNLTVEPGLVMSDSELETAQEEIDTAESKITSLEASIAKAENTIASNEKTIENLDNRIALAEGQLDNLNNFLENYTEALDKLMTSDEMDAELADTMTDYLLQIDEIQSSILSKEAEIMELYDSGPELEAANEDLLLQIEDYKEQISEQEEIIAELAEQVEETASASIMDKVPTYVILGAFVGVCCVCAYVFLKYCFDKTIHLEEDLSKYTGYPVIGSVQINSVDQRKKNPVDRLIDRLDGMDSAIDHTKETQCGIAAAKIQVLSGKRKVLVTGTVSEDLIQDFYTTLRAYLPSNEFEMVVAANPMYTSEEILKLKNYELVLVEAPHVTKVRELTDLAGFLKLSNVGVIGIISVT